jgi:hypothetical protein
MPSKTRTPEYCPECLHRVLGFKKVFCPQCGALSPTAGYGGRAARLRAQPAKPRKRSRFSFSAAA